MDTSVRSFLHATHLNSYATACATADDQYDGGDACHACYYAD